MGSHVSYLVTEIKILTISSDKSRCWCSFSRFSKHILLPIEKILQIDDLFKFEVPKFVYVSLNNKTPNSFCKYFCKTNDRSSRAPRQSNACNTLNIPRYRANKSQRQERRQRGSIGGIAPPIFIFAPPPPRFILALPLYFFSK